ncbi:MAG: hypothetical protein EU549_04410 [Promethearchaeota archaeon]|nr:MAG: hypothetical protein EU549_04410 [Candidatus Lokiarchaeota archaeon]
MAEEVVKEYPLGLPRGTIRAMTTILIVSFPFTYLLFNEGVPGLIINAIFILVAFYFEARKGPKERMEAVIEEMKQDVGVQEREKREIYPLYFPKYSVRISLLVLIVLILTLNYFGPQVEFKQTNTLLDILIILILYIIGSLFRWIKQRGDEKKLKQEIKSLKDYQLLSDVEIIEILIKKEPEGWKLTGKGIFSLVMFSCILAALILYMVPIDICLQGYSLQGILLLSINLYYGFRD